MCECCISPLKPRVDEDGHLLVPVAKTYDKAPTIDGWEPYWVVSDASLNEADGYAKVIKYRQPVPMYFICAYNAERRYMGPEEGGWGHEFRTLVDTVIWSAGDREWAERSCRALNRLARENGVAPGPYQWGTSGIVFSVDRWPGEDDTKFDGPVHYC